MNIPELIAKLESIGINNEKYIIYSINDPDPNEICCLNKTQFGWEVFYAERGNKNLFRLFESEHDACIYLFKLLSQPFIK